jgi:hypothetical protein
MFIARIRDGRTSLAPFDRELDARVEGEIEIQQELGRGIVRRRRSARELLHAFVRALPTRCNRCGGRVVRIDPMAAKSCNGCGRWAE